MFHTVAFSANMTSTNLGGLITPVVDPTVTISGNNLLIPDKFNNLFGAAAFATAASTATNNQLQAPSLREVYFPNLTPSVLGATFAGVPDVYEIFDNPIPLQTNEGLNYYTDARLAAPTGQCGAIVFLSDGKRQPVQGQRVYTMRCTATIQSAVNAWTNGAMTFNQTLPVGNYDVVGMRAEGTGLYAARLVFVGASAVVRPGCPAVAVPGDLDLYEFRNGRLGTWGSFYSLTPPSIDILGGTSSSQVIYLDLVPR